MNSLHKRLAALYEQRADLLEQVERMKSDPDTTDKLKQAAMQMKQSEAAMSNFLLTTVRIKANLEQLDYELKWTERQILAILGNPGLAAEPIAE